MTHQEQIFHIIQATYNTLSLAGSDLEADVKNIIKGRTGFAIPRLGVAPSVIFVVTKVVELGTVEVKRKLFDDLGVSEVDHDFSLYRGGLLCVDA